MNTLNEQDATLSAQSSTLVEKADRQALIEKFDDLKTPSGDDFEAMIRSGFNQIDDPIQVVEHAGQDEIEISSALSVKGTAPESGEVRLTPSQLSMTQQGTQTLTVDADALRVFEDALTVSKADETVAVSQTLTANRLELDSMLTSPNVEIESLNVTHSGQDIVQAKLNDENEPEVHVMGKLELGQALNVAQTTTTNDLSVSATSSLHHATAQTLTVKEIATLEGLLDAQNAIFSGHLHTREAISVGIDEQSADAKFHIAKDSDDRGALLRIDDKTQDSTPFYINSEGRVGVGTTQLEADFHVTGNGQFGTTVDGNYVQLNRDGKSHFQGHVSVADSASIGSEALPMAAGSLSVSGNLGLGKTDATAKLDVHGDAGGDLFNVATVNDQFVKVTNTPLQDEAKVTIYQATQVKDSLNVEAGVNAQSVTAQDVTAMGQLTANTATVTNQLTAGHTTVNELSVTTDATISKKATTKKLWVGDTETGVTEQDRAKGAVVNTTMAVKDHATFKDIQASEDIVTDLALKAKNAHLTQGMIIGAEESDQLGKLVVKASTAEESAVLVKDYEDNDLLRVKKQGVNVGTEGMAVPVDVKGTLSTSDTISAPRLNIDEHVSVHSQVKVAQVAEQASWMSDAKLAVLSDSFKPSALDVSHFNGQSVQRLITTDAGKVGLLHSAPSRALHVGDEALFDGLVEFSSQITVNHSDADKGTLFTVTDDNVSVGNPLSTPLFESFGGATIWGDSTTYGTVEIKVADETLLSTADSQVLIKQLAEPAALKIEDMLKTRETHIAAGQLAINQRPVDGTQFALTGKSQITGQLGINQMPTDEVDFGLTGQAQVNGNLTLLGEGIALHVQGEAQVDEHLTAKNGLTVSVTQNTAEDPKHALKVEGSSKLSGTLTVSENTQLCNGLHVKNDVSRADQRDVVIECPTTIKNTLTADDLVTANNRVIVKSAEGNALHVQGDTLMDRHVSINGDLKLNQSELPANARVHIQEQGKQGLLIERQNGQVGMVFNDGRLGIGIDRPDFMLDVAEDSQFRKDVEIKGRLEVQESLHVDEYASFRSNINVHGNTEAAGEARFGLPFNSGADDESAGMPAGVAQVAIDQNHFAKAFAVYHQGEKPVVIEEGRLGIQTDSPREALDVAGNAVIQGDIVLNGTLRGSGRVECFDGAKIFGDVELRSDLTVNDDVHLKDTLLVDGQATFNRHVEMKTESTFQGSVRLNDELSVHKKAILRDELAVTKQTTLQGGLTVEGLETGSTMSVSPAATFKNAVTVHGELSSLTALRTDGEMRSASITVTGQTDDHIIRVCSDKDMAPLSVNTQNGQALHINTSGDVGLGTDMPEHKLDVSGSVRVREALVVDQQLTLSEGAAAQGDFSVTGALDSASLQLGDTQRISGISADVNLGDETASDSLLATQAAVKAYVDAHCWTLAENNKVLLVQNQQEFDEVMARELLSNITILLLPHTCHPQMNRAYKLKQQVRIGSNVSIIGFNERETRIVKAHSGCRFLLHGQSDALISGVEMRGFTFDGSLLNGGVFEENGGAFHLRYVQSAKLNCVIENHHVNGDGGAIYGEAEVSGVEARHIKHCSSSRQGGGAFGLKRSILEVSMCRAQSGGAVAYCNDCQVVAQNNTATLHGGGAYKCKNLMAQGYWRANQAQSGDGKHIFSGGCDTAHDDGTHQDYWWHALYLDGPVMCGSKPWRNDHI
ncbi:hypothetical protein BGP78_01465 [Pseudoalteromonas sp. MSK9-3]|uniref:hypothetical protein n=1 Tax=Pseudoalteromonas sp. MSK9-3 TaxID=1897633 RepID=UPI000E6C267B|nr:hypothetical protein [Pseudoalteromonas sp. MSK9-3]RJE76943.1 hypothetical protein BGP78_01465 [Pseudoalteromonas sp. MSK9-3]